MLRGFACVLPLLASCMFIVGKDHRKVVREGDRWSAPARVGPARPIVASAPRGSGVAVTARWRGMCEVRGEHVTEYRVSRGADLKVWMCSDDGCEYIAVFGLLAAPVTLLVSGLITAAEVSSADDRTESKVAPLPPQRRPCDTPAAGLRVLVAAPGREPLIVTTDGDGAAFAELDDPIAAGQAMVQVAPRE